MQLFISWSGARSQAIANALMTSLPEVVPGLTLFHSDDIEKGRNWHSELIEALRGCKAGIFCVTPEALRSPWMHFEAGAMARHAEHSTLFAYLYGVQDFTGPLSHFQATHFDRADTRKLVVAVARLAGGVAEAEVRERFERGWPAFQARVVESTRLPIQRIIPHFPLLFEEHKTYHESFPECSDRRWDDRLKRSAQTHDLLKREENQNLVSTDPFLGSAYRDLLMSLDRYAMHLSSYLLVKREYTDLPADQQCALEDTRLRILDTVNLLQKEWPPPVYPESPSFETERAEAKRKELIHRLGARLRDDEARIDELRRAGASSEWALDRILYYQACGKNLMPGATLEDAVVFLRREEERARARHLVDGLQALECAAELVDKLLPAVADAEAATPAPEVPTDTAPRVRMVVDRVQRFLDAHSGRDPDELVRGRLASIREKLDHG